MGNPSLEAILKKKMAEAEKKIAEKAAPRINNLFKESVANAMVDYYDSYDPRVYERTNNFMSVYRTAETIGKGNVLTMTVNSDNMHSYPSMFENGKSLDPDIAYEYFFKNGEHGHGKWMMTKSIPPELLIDRDIDDKFGGRAEKIIQEEFNNGR